MVWKMVFMMKRRLVYRMMCLWLSVLVRIEENGEIRRVKRVVEDVMMDLLVELRLWLERLLLMDIRVVEMIFVLFGKY